MRILLILPAASKVSVTHLKGRIPRRAMKRFSVIPLLTVAAATPPGHEITICDENVQPVDLEADVDLVGITMMTAVANRGYEIAAAFRGRGIPVVAGGYHPTLAPEDVLPHVDAMVAGDAELAWPKVIEDAERGRLMRLYNEPCTSLEGLPHPRRDLLQTTAHHYATTNAVQAGRGCRHGCSYCSISAFSERKHLFRPVQEVVDEIRTLKGDLIFVDDNIIASPENARELFTALIPLKKRWVSQCSITIADDPDLLKLAHRSGCRGLFIGIESIEQNNLKLVSKEFNNAKNNKKRARVIHRAGIGIVAGMIVGMDHDGPECFEKTLRFLQSAGIECLQLNILTPLPGTPLFRNYERSGRIVDQNWEHYDFRHCVIRPVRMTAEELQDGADWLYRQFYRLDRVVRRTLRTLFTVGPAAAWLGLKLNLCYRYDNRTQHIVGRNPARLYRASRPSTVSAFGLSGFSSRDFS